MSSYFSISSGLFLILLTRDFNFPSSNALLSGRSRCSSFHGHVTVYLPSSYFSVSLNFFSATSLSDLLESHLYLWILISKSPPNLVSQVVVCPDMSERLFHCLFPCRGSLSAYLILWNFQLFQKFALIESTQVLNQTCKVQTEHQPFVEVLCPSSNHFR